MRSMTTLFLTSLLALFAAGCGGGGGGGGGTPGGGGEVAPSITVQPAHISVAEDTNASFSVSASGTNLSYQWYQLTNAGAVEIAGATAASYTKPSVAAADNNSQYVVIVSNSQGSVTSATAILTVLAANAVPTISPQPVNQTVSEGGSALFSALASGASPLTYQWQLSVDNGSNWSNIGGATSTSYQTGSMSLAQDGQRYRVVVTAGNGQTVTSSAAVLTVQAGSVVVTTPTITTHPSNQSVNAGSTASFAVVASGANLTYQWQVSPNGTDPFASISGATSSTYSTPQTTGADNGKRYRVLVQNSAGTATSNPATLNVTTAPSITSHPEDLSVMDGDSATFSVIANGATGFQWLRFNAGTDAWETISGATAASYVLNPAQVSDNGAQFRVAVTNAAGSTRSNTATLTVNQLATYTIDYADNGATSGDAPASHTKTEGEALTLRTNSGNLAKTGHTFAGWNTAANGSGASFAAGASYTADAAATLYAQWTANNYTVRFDVQGGSSASSKSVTYGQTYGTLPSTTRDGHNFVGWFTAANGGSEVLASTTVTATANHTLYAQWTAVPATFTISGNVQDGGAAAPKVRVQLQKRDPDTSDYVNEGDPVLTDEEGKFSFPGLTGNVDDYQVVVEGGTVP